MAERVGVVAAAAELGKDRRTLQRWKDRQGCPFGDDGLVDVEELRAWARAQGLLDRQPEDGRPTEVDRLAAGAASPQAPGAGATATPADRRPGPCALDELGEGDRDALAALVAGDRQRLIELAATVDLELLKRLAAMGRARAETAEAEKRELEVRMRRRELVPLEEVLAAWRSQVEIVKGGFLSLPGKAASALAAAGVTVDLGVLITTLERELHELLERFTAATPGESEAT